jgi:hypothetical protein
MGAQPNTISPKHGESENGKKKTKEKEQTAVRDAIGYRPA